MSSIPLTARKGFLLKKSKDGKWKRRFCETNGNFLNVYTSESLEELLSMIDLSLVSEVATTPFSKVPQQGGRPSSDGYNIRLDFYDNAAKSLILKSNSLEDAVEWVDVLRAIKEKASAKNGTVSSAPRAINYNNINAVESDDNIDELSTITEATTSPSVSNSPIKTNPVKSSVISEAPAPKIKTESEFMDPWPVIIILLTIIGGCVWVYFLYADQIPTEAFEQAATTATAAINDATEVATSTTTVATTVINTSTPLAAASVASSTVATSAAAPVETFAAAVNNNTPAVCDCSAVAVKAASSPIKKVVHQLALVVFSPILLVHKIAFKLVSSLKFIVGKLFGW